MDLTYTPEELAFQREVRAWLKRNVTKKERDARPMEYGDPRRLGGAKAWQRKVYDAGYLALAWPPEYGGQGADVMRQTIVNEEMVRARAPGLVGLMGVQMVGPTLIQHGTEEQRRRHLPKILTAEEIWCQGYSEPGAGSDLASLRTRAERDGDDFLVNGQKVWTSNAQFADWMFCLVRTDPEAPKHAGISYLLIDMKSPGITVRPLVQMTGDAGFNEVFFEDVRVPQANLVGGLNHDLARTALDILGSYGPLGRRDARVRDRGVWPLDYMFSLGLIIGGGTSQIQKNIIAERGLGLPREARPGR